MDSTGLYSLLVGDVIHQLNGHMGLIRTQLYIIQSSREDILAKDQFLSGKIEQIEQIVNDAASVIEEFRKVVLPQEQPVPVEIDRLLSSALSKVEIPNSVVVSVNVKTERPEAQASENITTVFRQLISNSIEAMPEGSSLDIIIERSEDNKTLHITFKDTGAGIPDYVAATLFKAHVSTKAERGRGLGLLWSRNYVESLNGRLDLVSTKVNSGSVFQVSLPCIS